MTELKFEDVMRVRDMLIEQDKSGCLFLPVHPSKRERALAMGLQLVSVPAISTERLRQKIEEQL